MMLSEGELHVQAMRLVCEALADREQQGLEVDWDVINQQLDHMDTILQGITDQRRDDAEEINTLRKDRDHWRQARQDAIQAGELMQAEIETLRQQLSADAVRQELEELKTKNFALQEKLATVENAAVSENETLRQKLTAAEAAVSLQRAGIERLQAFVSKVRSVVDNDCDGLEIDEMIRALDELNAGNSEATLNSSVVKDSLTTEAEGQQ